MIAGRKQISKLLLVSIAFILTLSLVMIVHLVLGGDAQDGRSWILFWVAVLGALTVGLFGMWWGAEKKQRGTEHAFKEQGRLLDQQTADENQEIEYRPISISPVTPGFL